MKRILIIGATSAIAEHCARIWAQNSNELLLVGRDDAKLSVIKNDLRTRGAESVESYTLDITEVDQYETFFKAIETNKASFDVVLIAHGTLPDQKACETDINLAMHEIETNALSVIRLLTYFANYFEVRKSGTIAVISSVAGDRGRASNYVYGSAKSMVSTFTSGLRQRLYKSNVSVVTIKPGFVDTPMTAEFKKSVLWAKPNKVAKKMIEAIEKKKSEVYLPSFWWGIMVIIKLMPSVIFNRLKL